MAFVLKVKLLLLLVAFLAMAMVMAEPDSYLERLSFAMVGGVEYSGPAVREAAFVRRAGGRCPLRKGPAADGPRYE